jgi:hypothetical protein
MFPWGCFECLCATVHAHSHKHKVRDMQSGRIHSVACSEASLLLVLPVLLLLLHQARTGGITEFVPLPFVHMEAPIYLAGGARWVLCSDHIFT